MMSFTLLGLYQQYWQATAAQIVTLALTWVIADENENLSP